MTESDYWRERADRDSRLALIEHDSRSAAIEEIKQAILGAVWQWEEAGRAARMSV